MVPCDVLLDSPNNASGSWLCGAASEKLDPTKPNTENAIKLSSFASGFPLKNDFGEGVRGAVRGRGVVSKNWGLTIGEAKVMVKNVVCARFGFGEFNGCGYLEVLSGWWSMFGKCGFREKI